MEGIVNKHAKIYIYIFFVYVHSRVMIVVVSERIQYAYANTNPTPLIIIKRETSDLKDHEIEGTRNCGCVLKLRYFIARFLWVLQAVCEMEVLLHPPLETFRIHGAHIC